MINNLLKETLEVLKSNGKCPADVRWVGAPVINRKCSREHPASWGKRN